MAELTIQVPDELAIRLEPLRSRLPELLLQLLETTNPSWATHSDVTNPTDIPPAYIEVLDFLINSPTPEEIAAFKVSPQAQARLGVLLNKNREETLTATEAAEINVYEQLEHLMILLKARAYASISWMTSTPISSALRQLVIERAKGRCEYCLMHQDFSIYSHEVDHIIALKHGGNTIAENLALACLPCNRHKGSDLATIDPISGEIIPLFNPRSQVWAEHFTLNNAQIVGITPIGRATVRLLMLNTPTRLLERQVLITQKRYS